MRLHYLQHVSSETPGSILLWAEQHGHTITHTLFHEDEVLPDLGAFDWLVIMGGPMNVYEEDRYPWLVQEKRFIGEAIATGKLVLGFCLGGQLIADVIGGKVTSNGRPELGWSSVHWTKEARSSPLFSFFPESAVVFQWHSDEFSVLPPEAEVLAWSDRCAHQAFAFRERVFGFQFHMENTADMIRNMAVECGDELDAAACGQSPAEWLEHPERIAQNHEWMSGFLDRLERSQGHWDS